MQDTAIVEAGTGTGKSFAYAAICMAMDKRVVIATSNKALQTQLYTKDIPFLQGLFAGKTMALAMGKSNYACNLKVQGDGLYGQPIDDAQFMHWYWWSDTGLLEECDFPLTWELRQAVAVDEECLSKHCPLYDHCYYYKARDARMGADVIVCNHALLAQHQVTGYLLPEWDVLVVDEAHNVADVVRGTVGSQVNVGALYKHINTARPYVAAETIQFVEARIQAFKDELAADAAPGFNTEVAVHGNRIFPAGDKLKAELFNLADMVWDEADAPQDTGERKAHKRAERLRNVAYRLGEFLVHNDRRVRWIQTQQGDKLTLYSMPYYVGDDMAALSQVAGDATIYCSATLATPDLTPFMASIGCEDALQLVAKSPFDYQRNAMLYVPSSADPAPRDEDFTRYLRTTLTSLVAASKGGALLLFTSRQQLTAMYSLMEPDLRKVHKLTVLQQDGKTSNQEIVRQFKADGNAVLFATRSFFEGVDIPGDGLRLVVLDKLPFDAPSPLGEAVQRAAGAQAFNRVIMPQMIVTLKQAAGRLIRTDTDRGVIAVLDSRIRAKWGRRVFESLPDAPNTYDVNDVAAFYGAQRQPVTVQAALFAKEPP
jgi:ATP-dependent DNA helicase DinG